jgi:hypothetical protein
MNPLPGKPTTNKPNPPANNPANPAKAEPEPGKKEPVKPAKEDNLNSSLPILKKNYLTSDNTNEDFVSAYEQRKNNIEDQITNAKAEVVQTKKRLQELEENEKQLSGPQGEPSKPAKPATNPPPNNQPATGGNKPGTANPGNKPGAPANPAGGKPSNPGPPAQPAGSTKAGATVQELEDPRMKQLLKIYKEKRTLKEKLEKSVEDLKKLNEKKHQLFKQYGNLQMRQNILKSVNLEPEAIKQKRKDQKYHSVDVFKNPFAKPEERKLDFKKLKDAKRGFYLDILETASSNKVVYGKEDTRYNLEAYAQARTAYVKDSNLKFSQVKMRGRANQAVKDPSDPENLKILRDSQILRESLAKSHMMESQHLKETQKEKQAIKQQEEEKKAKEQVAKNPKTGDDNKKNQSSNLPQTGKTTNLNDSNNASGKTNLNPKLPNQSQDATDKTNKPGSLNNTGKQAADLPKKQGDALPNTSAKPSNEGASNISGKQQPGEAPKKPAEALPSNPQKKPADPLPNTGAKPSNEGASNVSGKKLPADAPKNPADVPQNTTGAAGLNSKTGSKATLQGDAPKKDQLPAGAGVSDKDLSLKSNPQASKVNPSEKSTVNNNTAGKPANQMPLAEIDGFGELDDEVDDS